MKVVHIGTNIDSGAGLGLFRLHRDLLSRGVDSSILCMDETGGDDRSVRFPEFLRNRGFRRNVPAAVLNRLRLFETPYYRARRVVGVLRQKYRRTVSIPFSLFRIEEHPLVREADVVHLHWVSNFVDLPSFFGNIRKPVVWTVRDENPFLGYWHFRSDIPDVLTDGERREDDWLRARKLAAIRSCGRLAFVSLSRGSDEFAATSPAVEGRDHIVIPNSIDGSAFRPGGGDAVRSEFGIGRDAKAILFVSQRLADPRKGLSDLMEAVSGLGRTDIVILGVGSGGPPPVPKNVRFVSAGKVSDTDRLSSLFSAGDLFVTPAFAESFGKTTTEALACGTPVVTYPTAGGRDIVGSGDGIVAKGFSVDDLRAAVAAALGACYDLAAIRARVLERFSPSRVADAYIDLYGRLVR